MSRSDAELIELAKRIDITSLPPKPKPWQVADKMLAKLLDTEMTDWETDFCSSLTDWVAKELQPSPKQWEILEKLFVKYVE